MRLSFRLPGKKRRAIGWQVAVFLLSMILFSFIWSIIAYEVFPQYQTFQINNFPSGVFDPDTLIFMNTLVVFFPLAVLFSGGLWLWNAAQRKRGSEDLA